MKTMTKGINTATPRSTQDVDSLNPDQLAAVRTIRKLANMQKISPYTLGVFCARQHDKLAKLSDAKRLAKLTPATREFKIAEYREELAPYEPSVVAVFSAWCEQHDVDPWNEHGEVAVVVDEAAAAGPDYAGQMAAIRAAVDRTGLAPVKGQMAEGIVVGFDKPDQMGEVIHEFAGSGKRMRQIHNRRARAESAQMLENALGDGKPHFVPELKRMAAAIPVSWSTVERVANDIGVAKGRHDAKAAWSLAPIKAIEVSTPKPPQVRYDNSYEQRILRLQQNDSLETIANRERVGVSTLARWVELVPVPYDKTKLYGATKLPDRESDEGIELAEEVFMAVHPSSPQGVATRIAERRTAAKRA